MVKITEELIRKRSEHNEGLIYNLEEIALHQENIEKIEHLDKWCRDLKILLLQNNLIAKIENLGRLKKLEYLNLALNNIVAIENLEGCESLQKLDLTINFIGDLTCVESLKGNEHLTTLYLTGNPCTDYEGYRDFVIAVLPQLQYLDGQEIDKSTRIKATQIYKYTRAQIISQQKEYFEKERKRREGLCEEIDEEIDDEKFWSQMCDHSPETRIAIQKRIEMNKKNEDKEKPKQAKRQVKLISNEGRILNVNEAKIDFHIFDDEENNQIVLDLAVYKYLDTSLIDVDVQPLYVRAYIKGKAFQVTLQEEIKPDSSTAKRSETTGHLVITMPKVKEMVCAKRMSRDNSRPQGCEIPEKGLMSCIGICSIVPDRSNQEFSPPYEISTTIIPEDEKDATYVDDPSVPPLID